MSFTSDSFPPSTPTTWPEKPWNGPGTGTIPSYYASLNGAIAETIRRDRRSLAIIVVDGQGGLEALDSSRQREGDPKGICLGPPPPCSPPPPGPPSPCVLYLTSPPRLSLLQHFFLAPPVIERSCPSKAVSTHLPSPQPTPSFFYFFLTPSPDRRTRTGSRRSSALPLATVQRCPPQEGLRSLLNGV